MHILTANPPSADARLRYGPDPLNFGDLRLPTGNGPHPIVIVIHGGFWRAKYDLEHTGHLCAALTDDGYATWNIEYRRIGNPGGGWPGTFEDVAIGAKHVRELASEYGLDLSRVITLGHSAGGHLALWLAGCHKISEGDPLYVDDPLPLAGVVSLAGVCDLRRGWELDLSKGIVGDFLGGSPGEVPERYGAASPAQLLPLGVRQALVHGTEDDNVPYEISEHYYENAVAAGDKVELVTLEGAGHFEVIDPGSKEWPSVVGAVRSLL